MLLKVIRIYEVSFIYRMIKTSESKEVEVAPCIFSSRTYYLCGAKQEGLCSLHGGVDKTHIQYLVCHIEFPALTK